MSDASNKKPTSAPKKSRPEKDGKKGKKRGRSPKAALLVLLAVILLAGAIVLGYFATVVKTITVAGNSIRTDAEIINMAGLYTGKNIFSYDLGAAKRGIEKDPYLKCTGILRRYPATLAITVAERKEFAAILSGPSTYCVIDSSGYVLDVGRSEESVKGLLPIYGLSSMGFTVGTGIDDDKGKLRPYTVMQLIESIGDRVNEIRSIDISNTSSVKIIVSNGVTVMLGDSVNIPSKIERMFRALPKIDPAKAEIAVIYVNSTGTTDLSYRTPEPTLPPEPTATPGPEETEEP